MGESVFKVIIFLFAAYGLTAIILEVVEVFKAKRGVTPKLTVVLRVINQEEVVEGIIRKILKLNWQVGELELFVIDGGSVDDTLPILTRLKSQGQFHLLSEYNKEFILDLIEHSSGKLVCYLDLEQDLELINSPERLKRILREIA